MKLAKAVDPHIEATGGLAGLIIHAPAFPGWKSFGAMVNQFRFVRDHHKRIKRIAVVTDSHLGDVAEHLTSHFVSAEIKHFPAGPAAADPRVRLMLRLAAEARLRRAEIARVHTRDLTVGPCGAQLLVQDGKLRVVPIGDDLAASIAAGPAGCSPVTRAATARRATSEN